MTGCWMTGWFVNDIGKQFDNWILDCWTGIAVWLEIWVVEQFNDWMLDS